MMKQCLAYILPLLLFSGISMAETRLDDNGTEALSFFTEEGDLDMSNYLSQAYGFLPVPIIITEPAIGYGGGAAIVYLHDKFIGRKGASGRNIPPSMSGIILAGTENRYEDRRRLSFGVLPGR